MARPALERKATAADLIKSLAAEDLHGPPPAEYRRALLWAGFGLVWYLAVLVTPIFLLVSLTQDLAADSIVGPVRHLLGAQDRFLANVTGPESFLGWVETGLLPQLGPRGGEQACGLSRDANMPALPPGSQILLSDDFAMANASAFYRPPVTRFCEGKLLSTKGPRMQEIRAATPITHTFAGSSAVVIEAGVSSRGFLPGYGISVCSSTASVCVNLTLGTAPTLLRLEKRLQFCRLGEGDAQTDPGCKPQLAHAEPSSMTSSGLDAADSQPAHACHLSWEAPSSFALTISRERLSFRDDRSSSERATGRGRRRWEETHAERGGGLNKGRERRGG